MSCDASSGTSVDSSSRDNKRKHSLVSKIRKIWTRVKANWGTTAKLLKPMSSEEIVAAKSIDHIIVALGPYRNLTTMTAAIFALHPNAIVLNHAGAPILPRQSLNWIRNPEPKTLARFVRAAVRLCQDGQPGIGGSVLSSHAFDDAEVRAAYQKRFHEKVIKDSVSVLYWKESMHVTNYLISCQSIHDALNSLPSIKFLVPVRNPIDCANSNITKGYWQTLANEPRKDKVLDRIIELYSWIWSVKADYKDRFLFLWEHEPAEANLRALARFANLSYDPVWISDVMKTLSVRKRQQTSEEIEEFERCVLRRTTGGSELQRQLLRFVQNE